MGIETLQSNLLEAGAGFIIKDDVKDTVFSPGSLGFISFIKGIDDDYQNLAKVLAVMVRRGKGGKPRIDNVVLCVPIFNVDNDGFRKLMPEPGKRKYYVHIERNMPLTSDLMELRPLDFLGYSVALSKRIKHMSDQCRHKNWPGAKSNPINVLKKLPDYFEEEPEAYLEKYSGPDFRANFILEARRMISVMIRVHLQLDITRASAELHAAEFLLFANKGEFIPKDAKDKANEYKFTDDDAMLQETVVFHKRLRDGIEKLYRSKKKS